MTNQKKCKNKFRKYPTPSEKIFIELALDYGFIPSEEIKHQVIIGSYVADFVFPLKGLVIEIDGPNHTTSAGIARDKYRDQFIKDCGYDIWHVSNTAAETFDFGTIAALPDVPKGEFLRCQARANALRKQRLKKK